MPSLQEIQRRSIIPMTMGALLLFSLISVSGLSGGESAGPELGLRDNTPRVHALIGAKVVTAPGKVIENGIVILRDGLIEAVGSELALPADARVWDLSGKTIYPGFIDSYTELGLPKDLQTPKKKPAPVMFGARPPPNQKKPKPEGGAEHWNPFVSPQRNALKYIKLHPKEVSEMREMGFAAALIAPAKGVFRGQGCVVNLSGKSINNSLLMEKATQHIAFETNPWTSGIYPTSLMGTTALIRQTFYDARWHLDRKTAWKAGQSDERPETNAALDALTLASDGSQTILFEAKDELDYQRTARIVDEFDLDYAFLGNGHEYRKTALLREMGATVVLPLNFPEAPSVENPDRSLEISLEALQHWDAAPANAAVLAKTGIQFSVTTNRLKSPGKTFWKNIRKAVESGLEEEEALAALTTHPAELLDLSGKIGKIASGKIANLVVADGNLFKEEKSKILSVWIDGQRYANKAADAIDPRGTWALDWKGVEGPTEWKISGKPAKLEIEAKGETFSAKLDAKTVLAFPPAALFDLGEGIIQISAVLDDNRWSGTGILPDGKVFSCSGERTAPYSEEEDADMETPKEERQLPEFTASYPAGAFGKTGILEQPDTVLIRNATIWTSGSQGVLQNSDMLIRRGKIVEVGKGLQAPDGAKVIDASGKHVTAGLIDAHSHTAIARGVNEASHAVTVEVRVGDAIDPTDIGLYRELAGGLTTANLLHGSANPMGGQNQVIKLRWGEDAEGLKFQGAMPGVKFALGENVKQSNWGDHFITRYPQTRMGVDQIMRDTFKAAQDYERAWQEYRADPEGAAPRRNLRLEAALEILNKERIVHIHSYRQDEILAFARLAREMDFTVGTFQHILEGYKVADELAAIGAGGSTFSDWWAYKFEVYDAIPYNGALMHENGVLTSFNSDDNDLARRLNTEAAKAVKYGGVSEEDALNFVTFNPAKQLRINQWVGSLEPGKDADFVIWNGHPLSTFSRAEETWIEGRKYFDRQEDLRQQVIVRQERRRLIQKALAARLKKLEKPEEEGAKDNDKPSLSGLKDGFRSIYHNGESLETCSGDEGHHLN